MKRDELVLFTSISQWVNMRASLTGAVLIATGLAILIILFDTLLRLIIFIFEFVAVLVGVLLVIVGIGMLLRRRWMRHWRYEIRADS